MLLLVLYNPGQTLHWEEEAKKKKQLTSLSGKTKSSKLYLCFLRNKTLDTSKQIRTKGNVIFHAIGEQYQLSRHNMEKWKQNKNIE